MVRAVGQTSATVRAWADVQQGGRYGRWEVDSDGLPAYVYTLNQTTDSASRHVKRQRDHNRAEHIRCLPSCCCAHHTTRSMPPITPEPPAVKRAEPWAHLSCLGESHRLQERGQRALVGHTRFIRHHRQRPDPKTHLPA